MKRPKQLVELACARIAFANAALGPVEIHRHSEMSLCWLPLLGALSEVVPVSCRTTACSGLVAQDKSGNPSRNSTPGPTLRELPRDWVSVLPPDGPLTTIERWEQVFSQAAASDWPDGIVLLCC